VKPADFKLIIRPSHIFPRNLILRSEERQPRGVIGGIGFVHDAAPAKKVAVFAAADEVEGGGRKRLAEETNRRQGDEQVAESAEAEEKGLGRRAAQAV
jgi:hypothetical protein